MTAGRTVSSEHDNIACFFDYELEVIVEKWQANAGCDRGTIDLYCDQEN